MRRWPDAGEDRGERDRGRPAALGALDDAVDERRQPGRRQHGADGVEARRAGGPGGGDDGERAGQGEDREHDVQAEHRRPVEPLEQDAGGDEPQHAAAGCDAGPRADRLAALLGREHGGDHGQGHGHHERRADAHQHAQPDQLRWRVGEHRASDASPEQRESEGQHRLAADAVADRAGGQEQRRERQRVGVDDPLQLRLRGADVPRDRRQRNVQAGDGGDHHHQREAHHAQDRPALLSVRPSS